MTSQRRDAERIAADLYAIRRRLVKRYVYGARYVPWHQLDHLTRSYEIDIIEQALKDNLIQP